MNRTVKTNNTRLQGEVIPASVTAFPTTYREKQIGRTLYRVTSVFKGEKELGATLEKLAVQNVLNEMDCRAKDLLRA